MVDATEWEKFKRYNMNEVYREASQKTTDESSKAEEETKAKEGSP